MPRIRNTEPMHHAAHRGWTPADEPASFTCEHCGDSTYVTQRREAVIETEDGDDRRITVCVYCRDEIESAAGDRYVARLDEGREWPQAGNE